MERGARCAIHLCAQGGRCGLRRHVALFQPVKVAVVSGWGINEGSSAE